MFKIKETNIIKGIACLLLLFHHLFYYEPRWDMFWHIKNPPLIATPAIMAKVCVAIFVILSGYGLMKSVQKSGGGLPGIRFTCVRMIKLMSQYWFIYILFVPLGFLLGRSPLTVYDNNIIKAAIDFLGLSNLLGTPTMNATWWYMGAIIILYVLFPVFHYAIKRFPYVILVLSALVCLFYFNPIWSHRILYWIFPFITGMYIAEKDIFERFLELNVKIQRIAVVILFIIFSALRYREGVKVDTFFGLGIIGITMVFFFNKKYLSKALEFIGIHSGNIFMMHTFIYSYYFNKEIYSLWYPPLIFFALLIVCLILSVGIEKLKKITRYDKLMTYTATKIKETGGKT